jgi:hypothetical protein
MNDKNIFIHIPKTGGTTINAAMNSTSWQTKPGFNYRHIIADKTSNSGDIFDPVNIEKYKAYTIFMMLRDPIDRVISEYYFIKDRKEFIDLIKNKPKDFKAYIKSRQTQNYVVNFLKGRRMYDLHTAKEQDLKDIIEAVEKLPIHMGIFENFSESLTYFSLNTGIKWKKKIEVKRMTFKRPKPAEISNEIRELIIENNQLDIQLYKYAVKKFNELNPKLIKTNISFTKDKYNHVIPYCAKWCFFEFCMDNKKFIKQNFEYFKSLTFFLINEKGIRDGKAYTQIWNESFVNTISTHFPNSDFEKALMSAFNSSNEPLEQTNEIAKALDVFFNENKNKANKFYKPLVFKAEQVKAISKKGFLSRFFG